MQIADFPTPPAPSRTTLYSIPVLGVTLINSSKASCMLTLDFADVSKNGHPHDLAVSIPSDLGTCLILSRSHLFPTKTIGTLSVSFILKTNSLMALASSSVEYDVIL